MSETEIGDPGNTSIVEHHVGWFQVTVEHTAIVRGRETGADLPGD